MNIAALKTFIEAEIQANTERMEELEPSLSDKRAYAAYIRCEGAISAYNVMYAKLTELEMKSEMEKLHDK